MNFKSRMRVPLKAGGLAEVPCNTFYLRLAPGEPLMKFAVHPLIDTDPKNPVREILLSEYRSGQKLGSLLPIHLRFSYKEGLHSRITDKRAAEILINEVVVQRSLETVRKVIENAITLN